MKLAMGVLLAVAFFSLACQRVEPVAPQPQQLPQPLNAVATPVMELMPAPAAAPSLQFAKIISIDRPEDTPVTQLNFVPLSLKKRLPARAEVLLIPLNRELATLRTQVIQVSPIENPCSSSLPKLYETQLRAVTEQTWLKATAPFEVCVIYPVIATALLLNFEALKAEQIPAKVLPANITAALDTNNDEQPDVLLIEYCCDKPQQDRKTCDLTCSAVYLRDANGQWRIAETQTPC